MKKEMTVEALQGFFKSMSAAELRSLDANGGLLAWCPNRGVMLSVGDPTNRAFHEWILQDGLISTEIRTPAEEFKTKAAQVKKELIEDAEVYFCALDFRLDQLEGQYE